MRNEKIDQTNAYTEYYKVVKDFNSVNDEYLQTVTVLANGRKLAIQKAIEIHINPVLSRVRRIQLVSLVIFTFSFMLLCAGCIVVISSTNSGQISGVIAQGGFGVFLLVGAVGVGTLALILLLWTTSKLRSLDSNIQAAQKKANNPFVD